MKAGDMVKYRGFWDVWRSDGFCQLSEEGVLFSTWQTAVHMTTFGSQRLSDDETGMVLEERPPFVRVLTHSGKTGWIRAQYWRAL